MAIESIAILKQLFACYPNSQANEQTVAMYLRLLQDIPAADLQTVVDQCASQYKFLPSIAEIRDMYHTLTQNLSQPSAAEAWGEVQKQLRSIGSWGTPNFDDPLVAQVVQMIGWHDLCVSENTMADRAHFMRMYEQVERRKGQEQKLIPTARRLAASHNGGRLTSVKDLLPDFGPEEASDG